MGRSKVVSITDFRERQRRERKAVQAQVRSEKLANLHLRKHLGDVPWVLFPFGLCALLAYFHADLWAWNGLGWAAAWCLCALVSGIWLGGISEFHLIKVMLALATVAGMCYFLPALIPFAVAVGLACVVAIWAAFFV